MTKNTTWVLYLTDVYGGAGIHFFYDKAALVKEIQDTEWIDMFAGADNRSEEELKEIHASVNNAVTDFVNDQVTAAELVTVLMAQFGVKSKYNNDVESMDLMLLSDMVKGDTPFSASWVSDYLKATKTTALDETQCEVFQAWLEQMING